MTLLWEAVSTKKTAGASAPAVVQPISTRLRSLQRHDRCAGRTRAGRQCRCRKAKTSEFCNFHDPEIAARIRERARAKREERKRQLAALPEGYDKSLNGPDGIAHALDTLYREVRLGIVSPRTASVMLSIIDRLLVYDKLVATHGPRRAAKKLRAQEIRQQLVAVLEEMKLPAPSRPVNAVVTNVSPATSPVTSPKQLAHS